jgi:hypothetical protein
LYPSPADDFITIEMPIQDKPYSIDILNANGSQVFSNQVNTSTLKVNTQGFAAGFYTVKLRSETQTITRSIIICHP